MDPLISPIQTPETLAITAAANAPTSSCPSIAMLMTPARSPRQPARAPRISGIEPVRVFCSRLTMFSGMALPASAQHSSEMMKNSRTAAMLIRLARWPGSATARQIPRAIEAAPST